MPAAGESAADDPLTVSVDSATTEKNEEEALSVIFKLSFKKASEVGTEDVVAFATVIGKAKDKGRRETSVEDGDAVSANDSKDKRSSTKKSRATEVQIFEEGLGNRCDRSQRPQCLWRGNVDCSQQ